MGSLLAKVISVPIRNGDLFVLTVFVRKQNENMNILETSLLQNITLFLLFQPEYNVGL